MTKNYVHKWTTGKKRQSLRFANIGLVFPLCTCQLTPFMSYNGFIIPSNDGKFDVSLKTHERVVGCARDFAVWSNGNERARSFFSNRAPPRLHTATPRWWLRKSTTQSAPESQLLASMERQITYNISLLCFSWVSGGCASAQKFAMWVTYKEGVKIVSMNYII